MSIHTPGPLSLQTVKMQVGICHKIGPLQRELGRGDTYACVYDDGSDLAHPDPGLLSYAQLFTAAPEMLEALEAIISADLESVPNGVWRRAVGKLHDEARAAIRKARGEVT